MTDIRPIRIQLSRAKGFNLQAASLAINGLPAVKVDRTTRWGNDFIMAHEGTRALAVAMHREQAIAQAREFPGWFDPLRGKNLACWCPLVGKDGKPVPCHADVLIELANAPPQAIADARREMLG